MRLPIRILLATLPSLLFLPSRAAAEHRVAPPTDGMRKELKLSPFYTKCVVADGFVIAGSAKVSDYALREAAYLIDHMLAGRDDLRQALVKHRVRFAVMAPTELTCDIPEHSDLRPAAYWNKRARGLGATRVRPAVSCGEENLLGYPGDPYRGENILVHEFSHAIHEIALKDVDKTFDPRLADAFAEAKRQGLWKDTYAQTNRSEYWAEGVQSWFDTNRVNDNQHNYVATRELLRHYDPRLARLIAEVFRDNEWRYVPPAKRLEPGHLAGYDRGKAPRFVWSKEVIEAFEKNQKERK